MSWSGKSPRPNSIIEIKVYKDLIIKLLFRFFEILNELKNWGVDERNNHNLLDFQ